MNKFLKILLISSATFSLFSGPNEDLLAAAQLGNFAGVEAAIIAGADVNATDYGCTALILAAAEHDHTDIVRLLLDKGADINHADLFMQTALIWAAASGLIDTARLLLDRGANINATDSYESTALMFAAQSGHADTVRLLLKMDADIDATNNYGNTALDFARTRGHTEIVKILEETPKIKQLVDDAIQGDSSSYQKLIEKLKDLNIDSYEFNLVLNYLINKIKSDKINRNSRKLLLKLVDHIAVYLGRTLIGHLPEDILEPILNNMLPNTDLNYEFDIMHLDAHNQPIKKSLLDVIYSLYNKVKILETRRHQESGPDDTP